MAIRIRYGSDGNLLTAAAMAAGNQARSDYLNRQKDRDLMFITSELDRRARLATDPLYNEAPNDQFRRLQNAHTQYIEQNRPSATPTSQNFVRGGSGMADSIMAVKNAALDAAVSGGVSGSQKDMLAALASDPNVDASQFRRLAEDTTKQTQTTKRVEGNKQAKKSYFDSIAKQLPDAERNALAAMIDSDDVDVSQLRIAAGQALGRVAEPLKRQQAMAVAAVDDEIASRERQLREVVRTLSLKNAPPGEIQVIVGIHRELIEGLKQKRESMVNSVAPLPAAPVVAPGITAAAPTQATSAANADPLGIR